MSREGYGSGQLAKKEADAHMHIAIHFGLTGGSRHEMTAAQALVKRDQRIWLPRTLLDEKGGDYKIHKEKCDYHATTYQQALPSWKPIDVDEFFFTNIPTKHNAEG